MIDFSGYLEVVERGAFGLHSNAERWNERKAPRPCENEEKHNRGKKKILSFRSIS